MPLAKGTSRATVSRNISEMMQAGHPQAQAVAAAMREARSSRPGRKGSHRKSRRAARSARRD